MATGILAVSYFTKPPDRMRLRGHLDFYGVLLHATRIVADVIAARLAGSSALRVSNSYSSPPLQLG